MNTQACRTQTDPLLLPCIIPRGTWPTRPTSQSSIIVALLQGRLRPHLEKIPAPQSLWSKYVHPARAELTSRRRRRCFPRHTKIPYQNLAGWRSDSLASRWPGGLSLPTYSTPNTTYRDRAQNKHHRRRRPVRSLPTKLRAYVTRKQTGTQEKRKGKRQFSET